MKIANDHNWIVDGNEISINAILWCKEKYGLDIRYGFLEEINLPKNYYDAVVLWHSLEHVFDPQLTLDTCKEILRLNGLLLIAVPNKYGTGLIKYYEELHFYEFNLNGLHWWLQSYGFEPLEIIGIDHEEIPQVNLYSTKKQAARSKRCFPVLCKININSF
ncbi:MAG: class I SAM-dependent methyltransferase [Candidatus Kuenenia sp.]|nr:class I SAM-dependent methyltransferase [Candidatus Kuenenia hertensis]